MMAEQDVLAKPLPKPALPADSKRIGFKESLGISDPFLTRQSELQSEIGKADTDIAKGQQEQKEIKSTGELSAQMRFGQQQAAAEKGYQEDIKKEPLPAFIPSQDNAQDIAGLFSVISVISMLVGGGGRMSGQLALGNMNGMMEGYKKGRKDLYEKERVEFDKNFKAMLQKHAEFRQKMEDAVKLATTNKEEGFRAAEMAAVEAGSPIVQAQLRKGDLLGALKILQESKAGYEHAVGLEQKELHNEALAQRHKEAQEAAERRKVEAFKHAEQLKAEADAAALARQAETHRHAEKLRGEAEASAERRHKDSMTHAEKMQKNTYDYVVGADGKTYAVNKNNPKDIKPIDVDFAGAIKVGAQAKGTSSSQAQFENITSADIGNAYFRVNEYLSKSKDGKIPEGSKFLRDKGTQLGVIDAYKNWMVNRSLPPDLQGNDAALLGIAFDVVAARSFGRAAGVTDSKIAQVVRQLPVEGDSESTKQGKMRMLLNQLEEPNKLLPKEKRKDGSEYMVSPVSREIYTTYGGATSSEKKAMPTGEKLKAYTQAHPEFSGDEEKAKSYLRSQGYE